MITTVFYMKTHIKLIEMKSHLMAYLVNHLVFVFESKLCHVKIILGNPGLDVVINLQYEIIAFSQSPPLP